MAENAFAGSPEVTGESAQPPVEQERRRDLQRTFGAGPETVTGIQTSYQHEDRAARGGSSAASSGSSWSPRSASSSRRSSPQPETFHGISGWSSAGYGPRTWRASSSRG